MSRKWLPLMILPALFVSTFAGQKKAPPQPKADTTATGVFAGRSGKPMAKARLILAEVTGDQEVTYAKLTLSKLPAAITDGEGRFQIKGFTPGSYTIVYQPAGGPAVLPATINIKPFLAMAKSIAPLLRRVELGKNIPFDDRLWGREFTLLKGHTFFSEGEYMKIWNATVRRGQQGPYMEIRKGLIWLERIDNNSQIRFEAWSY